MVYVVVSLGSTSHSIGLVFPSNGIVPFILPEKGPVPVAVIIKCARSPLQMVSSPALRDNTADLVWLQLFTIVTVLSTDDAVQPDPALDVSLSVTVPLKFAAGVYVTDAGVAVCAVLLNVPPPDTIDHAPVVALPPTLAPVNAKATGEAD